jgi:site-specific recombinase XerC
MSDAHFPAGQRLTLDMAFEAFRLLHMPAKNLSATTRRGYTYDVAEGLAYLEQGGTHYVDQLDLARIQGYLAALDGRGLTGNSRRRKVIALKAFLRYLEDQGLLRAAFSAGLIWPHANQDEPRALTKEPSKNNMNISSRRLYYGHGQRGDRGEPGEQVGADLAPVD